MMNKALLSLAAAGLIYSGSAALQPDTAHATFFGDRTHTGSSWGDGWRQMWAEKMARKCAWKAQHGWNPSWCAQYTATQYAPAPAPAPYRPLK